MDRYVINKQYDDEREVEGTGFATVGDFIDFYTLDDHGSRVVALRIRAAHVQTVDRISQ